MQVEETSDADDQPIVENRILRVPGYDDESTQLVKFDAKLQDLSDGYSGASAAEPSPTDSGIFEYDKYACDI